MNYDPPPALSAKGWRYFKAEFKEKAPIRYWFSKRFRRLVILPIKWKYEAITQWISYRSYDRYHIVNTGLKPGYYEIDTLMLHANFNMLKDFVEVEQAMHTYYWSDECKNASWWEKHMPFYRTVYPFRMPGLGIQHLTWASKLDDPSLPPHERSDSQAKAARETLILYKWWVDTRPARLTDPHVHYDNQGLGSLGCFDDDFDTNAADYKAHRAAMDNTAIQEEKWREEDTDMLVRLIRIRHSLWT